MPSFPEITLSTASGVTVAPLRATDAPALVDSLADPVLRQWLPLPFPYTRELADSWCTTISAGMRTTGSGFVVGVHAAGQFVGSIDAKRVDWRARTLELSCWTAAPHRGRGYMPDALCLLTDWLLSSQEFERVELRIATGNAASARTAAKAGFRHEGVARNAGFTDAGRVDLAIFSRIRADAFATG